MDAEDYLEALLAEGEETKPSQKPDLNKALEDMQQKMEIAYIARLEAEKQKMKLELAKEIREKTIAEGKKKEVVEVSDHEEKEGIDLTGLKVGYGLMGSMPHPHPFGVQRTKHNNGSSPYGVAAKPKEKDAKDPETMEEIIRKTQKTEEEVDTGQEWIMEKLKTMVQKAEPENRFEEDGPILRTCMTN